MIKFNHTGKFNKSANFLKKASELTYLNILEKYAKIGVEALSSSTPKKTGTTAGSWFYKIEKNHRGYAIYWANSNTNKGIPIAILIQYGHGTGTGGYVKGIDYINPAIRPIFDKIANDAWKEVSSI